LNCQLEDKTVLDENVWNLVSIDHGIQNDGQSCGVFVLKVRYVHNILSVSTYIREILMRSVELVLNTTYKDSNFSMSSPLSLLRVFISIFVGRACKFSLYYTRQIWCRVVK